MAVFRRSGSTAAPAAATPLPPAVEECARRLSVQPDDAGAAASLRAAAAASPELAPDTAEALHELADALLGGPAWAPSRARDLRPPPLGGRLRDQLLLHPREREEGRHRLASALGRVLHLLEGDEIARTVVRVTERAEPAEFPGLCRLRDECSRALDVPPPPVQIARGEEPLFTALLDRAPFLCLHARYAPPGELTPAELRFGLGRQCEHVKAGHVALLQVGAERLEGLVLDEVPFLVRTPLKLATRALGWTRANVAVKRVGRMFPEESRSRKVVSTVGDLLPDHQQDTVLPEVVHDWLRRWLQGVELSADRGGLLLCGGPGPALSGLVALTPALAPHLPAALERGLLWLLREHGGADRAASERLLELVRFAVSSEYLSFHAGVQALRPPSGSA